MNKKIIIAIALGVCFFFGISIVPGTAARATTIQVGHGSSYGAYNEDNYSGYPGAIQAAVNAANSGDKIIVATGNYAGAKVNKSSIEIEGSEGTYITSGYIWCCPPYAVAFFVPSPFENDGKQIVGVKISKFIINCSQIDNGYGKLLYGVFGHGADNVTVSNLVITNSYQAITNTSGRNWVITHNTIIGLDGSEGEGFGIALQGFPNFRRYGTLEGQVYAGDLSDNLIAFNTIEATNINGVNWGPIYDLYYFSAGIVLDSYLAAPSSVYDFPPVYLCDPPQLATRNTIVNNKVSVSGTPVNNIYALRLEDEAYYCIHRKGICGYELYGCTGPHSELSPPYVKNNIIAYNDFQGSKKKIAVFPGELTNNNSIQYKYGEIWTGNLVGDTLESTNIDSGENNKITNTSNAASKSRPRM